MIINLISKDNGVGLTQDVKIVKSILSEHDCKFFDIHTYRCRNADINIFFELLDGYFVKFAKVNLFFPNPEWFWFHSELSKMDMVLCKTHDAVKIFKMMGCQTVYTSFTSMDCWQPVEKYRVYLHAAGQSETKGTQSVFSAWKQDYPELIFTKLWNYEQYHKHFKNIYTYFDFVPEHLLREWQNKCYFHVCPSSYEGFGHYIWEAKSCGGIVITTNGVPMRDFVTNGLDGLLVKPVSHRKMNFASTSLIHFRGLQEVIEKTFNLTDEKLVEMSKASRQAWVENDKYFKEILTKLINSI